MPQEITSTHEIEEAEWDGEGEPYEPDNNLTATKEPDDTNDFQFHVQMRAHTMRDMETLIVEAAGRLLLEKYDDGKRLDRLIEERCIELLRKKADAALEAVTSEIIDQPMIPKMFGSKDPVTMREFLGLYGREYLTQTVTRDGKPDTGYGAKQRMVYLASSLMDAKFKREIEASTRAMLSEIQKEMKARHDALLAEERARIKAALEKATT